MGRGYPLDAGQPLRGRPKAQRWKAAWRVVGGKRCYFRSKWEANYARYLEWMKEKGLIQEWEHEPETFWFDGIRRGVCSYLPDFRVTSPDGAVAYHEVKGWMDPRSKVKLARMAKYHPAVAVVLIDESWFKRANQMIAPAVPGWE